MDARFAGPFEIDYSDWFDIPVTVEQWTQLQLLGAKYVDKTPRGGLIINGVSLYWDGKKKVKDGVVIISGCGGRILTCDGRVP